MTRTKINKTIAILLAMCLAFALMSVTMLNNAKAEGETGPTKTLESGVSYTIDAPEREAGAPNVSIDINFPKNEGDEMKPVVTKDTLTTEYIKVYSDKEHTKEVVLKNLILENVDGNDTMLTFTVPLSKVSGLTVNTTYYLVFSPDLTKTSTTEGEEIEFTFLVKQATTKSTTSTTRTTTTTTRRTTRTYTTYRTVTTRNSRANPANTDDPSHMPLWVGIMIIAAGATGIAYVWKQKD